MRRNLFVIAWALLAILAHAVLITSMRLAGYAALMFFVFFLTQARETWPNRWQALAASATFSLICVVAMKILPDDPLVLAVALIGTIVLVTGVFWWRHRKTGSVRV